jgi:hypothetical protein
MGDLLKNKRWLEGPDFLWKTKDQWPKSTLSKEVEVKTDDPEVTGSLATITTPVVMENMDQIFAYDIAL